jgi:hypothetical protein
VAAETRNSPAAAAIRPVFQNVLCISTSSC